MTIPSPVAMRDFAYTPEDFRRVQRLIHAHAGIALSEAKEPLVYSRLARRLRALGLVSFRNYLDRLEQGEGETWQAFVNALTTNLTAFFRERHHFDRLAAWLRERGLPSQVRIWSAAASTGEEPYSIAITLMEAYGTTTPPAVVLATDIDTQVLTTAAAGVYPLERVERLPEALRQRYFLRGKGRHEGEVRVIPELQHLVSYKHLNLLEPHWPMRNAFDLIFCRNVMIYFDKPTQHAVIERMTRLMQADSLLFAGHSESFFHARDLIECIGQTTYRLAHPAPRSH